MRRKDRELPCDETLKIIDDSEYAVVSVIDGEEIFSVPMSIARVDMNIYMHGAVAGTKARIFKDNKIVKLVCVSYNKVPNFSDKELENLRKNSRMSSIFTTEYKSAIVSGEVSQINDEVGKIAALKALSQKYTPQYMSDFNCAIKEALKYTNVYKIEIKNLSAKAKII